jgi:hypothetical protein
MAFIDLCTLKTVVKLTVGLPCILGHVYFLSYIWRRK